ncbi:hypothetical protein KSP40_PGU021485 [Platanthera guangdongensis]|uniref:Uncharacterized protein n=1 Tax=Platanthera guangdongensis TaxID=2320717 RepID=A0ABR2MUW3_9ASPA
MCEIFLSTYPARRCATSSINTVSFSRSGSEQARVYNLGLARDPQGPNSRGWREE